MKKQTNTELDIKPPKMDTERSEEVQVIIDRMPTYWVKWVVLCVSVLMGVIICLGFIIQYPDTVDGEISITAKIAPVRLISNANARLHLIKPNKTMLQKGDVIAYLENGANYTHIQLLESLLSTSKIDDTIVFPDSLVLGDLCSYYNAFLVSNSSYQRLPISGIKKEQLQNFEMDIASKKSVLLNAIKAWKDRYLQCSPIDGELEYLGFWKDNTFVQAGEELFTVIPAINGVLGEAMIPAWGAGKVEVNQSVNVKLNKYPYDEYGLIRGKVKSISRLTNKVSSANGTIDVYQVIIDFPKGLVTNFGQKLRFDFDTKGVVEIITRRKCLVERMFDNLKSRTVK